MMCGRSMKLFVGNDNAIILIGYDYYYEIVMHWISIKFADDGMHPGGAYIAITVKVTVLLILNFKFTMSW